MPIPLFPFQNTFIEGAAVPAEANTALRFNSAQSQFVLIPSRQEYNRMGAFTISAWFYVPATAPTAVQGYFGRNLSYRLSKNSGADTLDCRVHMSNNTLYGPTALAFSRNYWNHYCVTYDGITIRWYLNGTQVSTQAISNLTLGRTDATGEGIRLGHNITAGYGTVDLSDFRVYNYNISLDDIDSLSRRTREANKRAYISVGESQELDGASQQAVVVSYLSDLNPLIASSSVGLAMATTAEVAPQLNAYIFTEEDYEEFDTNIIIENRYDIYYDNLIIVTGSSDSVSSIKKGEVVYPISRDAVLYKRIYTWFYPGIEQSYQDAWLQTHHVGEDTKYAYINVGQPESNVFPMYLHGHYSPVNIGKLSYIVNNTSEASIGCHMDGDDPYSYILPGLLSYVSGPFDKEEGQVDAFIYGSEVVESGVYMYVSGPFNMEKWQSAYISTSIVLLFSENKAYMHGRGIWETEKYAFIGGHYSEEISKNAYIPVINSIDATQHAFIRSEGARASIKRAHLPGMAPDTSTLMCYLKSDISSTSLNYSFIGGVRGRSVFVPASISVGEDASNSLSSVSAYIENSTPYTVYAFINCDPQSSILGYIVNQGSRTRGIFSYVAGV
jgi:hypothetical protein